MLKWVEPPIQNGQFSAHNETKVKLVKDLVICYLLNTLFSYWCIYSKNEYQ